MKFILSGIFALMACVSLYAEESSGGVIFYGNAKIYGKELVCAKENTPAKVVKKAAKVKKKESAPTPVEKKIAKQKPVSVVFPIFPLSSSSSFLQSGHESAAISPQQKLGDNHSFGKVRLGNAYPDINNLALFSYCPEQRQKLSVAATQCGTLTSFGAQSPPLLRVKG